MKTQRYGFLLIFTLLLLTGCDMREWAAGYVGVEDYTVTVSDMITVSDGTQEYLVLDETADNEKVGKWIGRVDAFKGNVYVSSVNSGRKNEIFVMVNGIYYRARPKDAIENSDDMLCPSDVGTLPIIERVNSDKMEWFSLGNTCYVLSKDEVDDAQLGEMIAIINMSNSQEYRVYKGVYSLPEHKDAIAVVVNGRNIVATKEE